MELTCCQLRSGFSERLCLKGILWGSDRVRHSTLLLPSTCIPPTHTIHTTHVPHIHIHTLSHPKRVGSLKYWEDGVLWGHARDPVLLTMWATGRQVIYSIVLEYLTQQGSFHCGNYHVMGSGCDFLPFLLFLVHFCTF